VADDRQRERERERERKRQTDIRKQIGGDLQPFNRNAPAIWESKVKVAGPSGRAVLVKVYGRSPAEIVGSNSTADMGVCLL
jgi:hypothetical protein